MSSKKFLLDSCVWSYHYHLVSTYYNTVMMTLQPCRSWRHLALSLLSWGLVLMLGFTGCGASKPMSRTALVAEAKTHLQQGQIHQALEELNQLLQQDPQNLEVHINRGWAYLYTNQMDKALSELQYALDKNPDSPQAMHLKGGIYQQLEQWQDAQTAYAAAIEAHDQEPQLYADMASVSLKLNNTDQALKAIQQALQADPDNAHYWFVQCQAFIQNKAYAQAQQSCDKALQTTADETEHTQIETVIQTIGLLQSLEPMKKPSL